MNAQPTILVIAAMRGETRALRRRLRRCKSERWCGLQSWTGQLDGIAPKSVRVVHCGIGAAAAKGFTHRVLESPDVDLGHTPVVIIGLAGGLDPQLELCAVAEVSCVVDGASASDDPSHAALRLDSSSQVESTLLTAPQLLTESSQKRDAWRSLDSASGAMVDMETFHLVAAFQGHVKSIRCARAVSDTCATNLPRALAGESGPHPWRLVGSVIRNPTQVGDLIRLGRTARRCGERLADWVQSS